MNCETSKTFVYKNFFQGPFKKYTNIRFDYGLSP